MKNAILLQDITPEEFQNIILEGVKKQLEQLKRDFQPKQPNEYMTRQEVANMLKIDLSSIYNWTKKGKLTPYGIGGRVYYKRQEIEEAIIRLS